MTTSSSETVDGSEASFDVRWAHWQEAGAAQARALDRRAAIAAIVVFCTLAAGLVIAVYFA